jgi:hypothetical protein
MTFNNNLDYILHTTKLSNAQRKQLSNLLSKYENFFTKPVKLRQVKVVPHPIHTLTVKPVAMQGY